MNRPPLVPQSAIVVESLKELNIGHRDQVIRVKDGLPAYSHGVVVAEASRKEYIQSCAEFGIRTVGFSPFYYWVLVD